MADIFEAYKFLNSSLDLGLSENDIVAEEAKYKELFAEKVGITGISGVSFRPEEWEFFANLTPINETLRQQRRISD